MTSRPSGIVTLTTDFGLQDPSVGIMKAALLSASEKPRVIDLTHGVEPQDVAMGAFMLFKDSNSARIDKFVFNTEAHPFLVKSASRDQQEFELFL